MAIGTELSSSVATPCNNDVDQARRGGEADDAGEGNPFYGG